jgi:predicted enzyme related to lactoylglutathione lyase
MLNLNSLMLSSNDSKSLIEFYNKVLGIEPSMVGEGEAGWQVGATFFGVSAHSEITGKTLEPARVIINFETNDVKGEFDRIKATGATVVKEPYLIGDTSEMWIATFSDLDGNLFQLMSPWQL